jgi:Na+-transporting NADH:ubiquinone oxidoreductase subunit B
MDAFNNSYSMFDSFIGMIPGSVGETSVIACLLGAALLLFTGVGSIRIMLSFGIGGFVTGLLMNAIGTNPYMDLPAAHHLLIGGFAFGAVFMATDPVTAAQTATGKIIYGFFGGMVAILIRVLNPAYPEGVMLAILFMNVTAPIIDHYVVQANIKRRLKRLKTA